MLYFVVTIEIITTLEHIFNHVDISYNSISVVFEMNWLENYHKNYIEKLTSYKHLSSMSQPSLG